MAKPRIGGTSAKSQPFMEFWFWWWVGCAIVMVGVGFALGGWMISGNSPFGLSSSSAALRSSQPIVGGGQRGAATANPPSHLTHVEARASLIAAGMKRQCQVTTTITCATTRAWAI